MKNMIQLKKYLWLALLVCAPCFAQSIDVAFSPEKGAEALILKTIRSAQKSIHLAAYSFTNPDIARELINAKRRGVDVKLVVDAKSNKARPGKNAMNLMANANIPIRAISTYKIHHDKYIIVDEKTVETGSFNYSRAAADGNSENVIVIYDNPSVAKQYKAHWQSRWNQAVEWKSTY